MRVTIGFDPGKDGGYAMIGEGIPTVLGALPYIQTELDTGLLFHTMRHLLTKDIDVLVVIEKVHAMPKQGSVSMFTFGSGFGELKALAKILAAPWALVPPQTWKKHVLAGTDKSKGATIEWAHRTYPDLVSGFTKKSGLAHLGKVDALAIAHYGHHFHPR